MTARERWVAETLERLLAEDDTLEPRVRELNDRITGEDGLTRIWGYIAELEERIATLEGLTAGDEQADDFVHGGDGQQVIEGTS